MNSPVAAALPGLVATILFLVAMVVALILVATRARGRAKQLGLAGCAVLAVGALLRPVINALVPVLGAETSILLAVTLVNAIGTVVDLIGIALLVAAVIAGSTSSSSGGSPGSGWGAYPGGPAPR